MIRLLVSAILILWFAVPVFGQHKSSQAPAYDNQPAQKTQLRWIIDTPTAGMLPRGAFDLDMKTFVAGGLQATLGIGLMDRFSVGLGYGASAVLSDTMPDWNPRLEFQIRYRLLEESNSFPALAVGYSSQGYSRYDTDNKRFRIKSPGFYLAFSKNFNFYDNPAGWHGGINYSLENKVDNDPSGFIGFNSDLGNDMLFLAEYDFGFNDNKRSSIYGLGRGFLNMGLAWYLTDRLSLELDLKNLFRNHKGIDAIDREARLVYVEYFY